MRGDGFEERAPLLCPHCGEATDVFVDEGGGEHQEYIEDCCVCCRPIQFVLTLDEDGEWRISASADV